METLELKINQSKNKFKNNKKIYFRGDTRDQTTINEFYKCDYTKDDIWLDCGANIGTFPLYCFDHVKEIISYEPEPDNCEIFKKNMEANNIKNFTLIEKALVENDDEERTFYVNPKYDKSNHSLIKKGKRDEITVQCENINVAIKKYNINKIKMDVEGYEYYLIKAIADWDRIKEFYVEWHYPTSNDENIRKLREIIAILDKNFDSINIKLNDHISSWGKVFKCHKNF